MLKVSIRTIQTCLGLTNSENARHAMSLPAMPRPYQNLHLRLLQPHLRPPQISCSVLEHYRRDHRMDVGRSILCTLGLPSTVVLVGSQHCGKVVRNLHPFVHNHGCRRRVDRLCHDHSSTATALEAQGPTAGQNCAYMYFRYECGVSLKHNCSILTA